MRVAALTLCDSRPAGRPGLSPIRNPTPRNLAGASSFAFSGRYAVAGKDVSLKPGRYKMTGVATDVAGNKSTPSNLEFQIVK